jgi:pyruvate/2-oxoglutarate dehydrogenase complex dihydrolipoamide dehydrogenase (E3) component
MTDTDILVIGAGSAGLSVAAGAVQLGARVVLCEKAMMGGDCLNYGCVPSKSLIRAAEVAHLVRDGGRFGVNGHEPGIDFAAVRGHIRSVIDGIAPNDSEERFTGLGVRVVRAAARFVGRSEVEAGGERFRARRIVVATGSSPAVPPIPGIEHVPYLTNETVFELAERPEHLIVIGGGPIGVELAQAHRRLGARVTLLERFAIMPKDEADAVDVVRSAIVREGVEVVERAEINELGAEGNGVAVRYRSGSGSDVRVVGSHLLVAAGRRPNVEGLDLEAAGIAYAARGIDVDARLRTSNHKIYAIGDVTGGLQFTHMAAHQASVVVRNALFRLPAKVDLRAVPWVTYTDPELAQVGLTRSMAGERGIAVEAVVAQLEDNDRARAEGETRGFVRILVDRAGRVVGATIVGPRAGELIQLWGLVIQERIKLSRVAQMILPYPTLSEINKRVAGSYFAPKLFSDRTRSLVRLLLRLP